MEPIKIPCEICGYMVWYQDLGGIRPRCGTCENRTIEVSATGEPLYWHIKLNRYQRDNLLWLMTLVTDNYIPEHHLNSGDWAGEVRFLLSKLCKHAVLDESDRPNSLLPKHPNDTQGEQK